MTDPAGVRLVPVADRGVLVEFPGEPDDATAARVRAFDRRVTEAGVAGVVEVVPAYVSALVVFDPMVTDHDVVAASLRPLAEREPGPEPTPRRHRVPVCYDPAFGVDLAAVAEATGLTTAEVVRAHTGASHRVVMFGFSPGASYLSGVDPAIQLPRKSSPVRDVPAGSVIIAGPQCLVMTVTMPTGWWVIGRTPLTRRSELSEAGSGVDVGDVVEFEPIDQARFEELGADAAMSESAKDPG